jgi:hypothetical protein
MFEFHIVTLFHFPSEHFWLSMADDACISQRLQHLLIT